MRLGRAPTRAGVSQGCTGGSDKLPGCASVAGATQVYGGTHYRRSSTKRKGLRQQRRNPLPSKCNYKSNRYTVTLSHSAQLDATTKKRYSPLPSMLSSIFSELSSSEEIASIGFCKPQVGGSIPLASSKFVNSLRALRGVERASTS
jgi:hypothetical protein